MTAEKTIEEKMQARMDSGVLHWRVAATIAREHAEARARAHTEARVRPLVALLREIRALPGVYSEGCIMHQRIDAALAADARLGEVGR